MPLHHLPLLLLFLLPGCDASVTGGLAPDAVVSSVSGRDCSAVRLDQGQGYCRQPEPPPTPPTYCTRSIGRVDCWRAPPLALPLPAGVADGRVVLTAEQEAHRMRRWPGLW